MIITRMMTHGEVTVNVKTTGGDQMHIMKSASINVMVIAMAAMLVFNTPLCASINDKHAQGGLAVQAGYGILYGGMGGLIEYQFLLKDKVRITPLIGIGGSLGGTDSTTDKYYFLNYTLGLNFEYGNKHRAVAGLQFLGSHDIYNNPSNAKIDKKDIVGPDVIIGYKGTAYFGLLWQVYFGCAYAQNPFLRDISFFFEPHFGFGIGYKF
jgi:hypothetical protein